MGPDLQSKDPHPARVLDMGNTGCHRANNAISKKRTQTSQENKIVIECYLLCEPTITGYRKRMQSLWLQKSMFQVSEQS